ncbi:1-phosphofructokinase [Thermogemmatispora aurantia]|uniref:1-phosphofructokinase n=1 Tax=Thermogemmatispora aurantia TaxID=2045279 RepID=A0A5J4KGF0_9CHLR|nr:1-phosphofructokinase [Thermogemmatispora aurantia]GER85351.1 1-phosphofructokinase [Thermogemmatispora aurantia]
MKVATVTLNPAIDQTVRVASLEPGHVHRARTMLLQAGGKGINVAAFLAASGCPVIATGFLGSENASVFERFFAERGIADAFVRLPGQTRIDIKIVDEERRQTTDINLPGLAPSEEALSKLWQTVEDLAADCRWFVLAGALPPAVPSSLYATFIARLKALGRLTVLDASGEALAQGILAGPTLVKPNRVELEQLVGQPLTSLSEVAQAARSLLRHDIRRVVVSLGEQGALFVEGEQVLQALPPAVTVESTVGAGDAMVAALVLAEQRGLDLAATARLATAYALARISRLDGTLPPSAVLEDYSERVRLSPLALLSAEG